MKLIIKIVAVILIIASCGTGGDFRNTSETMLSTVRHAPSALDVQPAEMVYVELGSFSMGANDESVPWADNNTPQRVTVEPFYILQTEVSNVKYKAFVKHVKDSLIRTALGQQFDEFMIREDADGNPIDPPRINWSEPIDMTDPEVRRVIDEAVNFPVAQRVSELGNEDISKFVYNYKWVDFDAMVSPGVTYDPYSGQYSGEIIDNNSKVRKIVDRTSFVMEENINIYPDELCWIRGLSYSYNIPNVKNYFKHIMYSNYPVVGINWRQARAYCQWFTTQQNKRVEGKINTLVGLDFRLPTEAEWEYAARGGNSLSMYPWGGPYIRNSKGCFLANFKPFRGNYSEDGAAQAAPVASYTPNGFGVYDMAGNVAEWTEDAYETVRSFVADINPVNKRNTNSNQPMVLQRKVVRGGSWKDIGYYLQNGTRTYEYQDNTKPYIGFRYVRSASNEFKLDI